MSKLIEKLEQASRGAAQAMGFKTASAPSSQSMVLIAALPMNDLHRGAEIVESQVDALVAYVENPETESLGQIARVAGDVPWGLWLEQVTVEGIKQLEEAGGDFLIFEPANAPAALLQENKVGKVLKVDPVQQDSLLSAVGELAVDAVLIDVAKEGQGPTVSHLMYCQWIASVISKPLLMAVPSDLAEGDLQALWEAGANGVVVKVEEEPKKRLLDLQQMIKTLPSRTKKQRRQGVALLPRLERGAPASP